MYSELCTDCNRIATSNGFCNMEPGTRFPNSTGVLPGGGGIRSTIERNKNGYQLVQQSRDGSLFFPIQLLSTAKNRNYILLESISAIPYHTQYVHRNRNNLYARFYLSIQSLYTISVGYVSALHIYSTARASIYICAVLSVPTSLQRYCISQSESSPVSHIPAHNPYMILDYTHHPLSCAQAHPLFQNAATQKNKIAGNTVLWYTAC